MSYAKRVSYDDFRTNIEYKLISHWSDILLRVIRTSEVLKTSVLEVR